MVQEIAQDETERQDLRMYIYIYMPLMPISRDFFLRGEA